eukprot:scaffold502_cov350-Pavlova_lutheri.AAC.18
MEERKGVEGIEGGRREGIEGVERNRRNRRNGRNRRDRANTRKRGRRGQKGVEGIERGGAEGTVSPPTLTGLWMCRCGSQSTHKGESPGETREIRWVLRGVPWVCGCGSVRHGRDVRIIPSETRPNHNTHVPHPTRARAQRRSRRTWGVGGTVPRARRTTTRRIETGHAQGVHLVVEAGRS